MNTSRSEQTSITMQNRLWFHARTKKWNKLYLVGCALFCVLVGLLPLTAQPSGGPYGPIRQTYNLPVGAGKIYYVAPDGKAEEPGETLARTTTLEAAME